MTQRTTATLHDLDWLLDGLVEQVPGTQHAIVLSDRNGLVEWANDAFERMTGYTLAETRGAKVSDLLRTNRALIETQLEHTKRMRFPSEP